MTKRTMTHAFSKKHDLMILFRTPLRLSYFILKTLRNSLLRPSLSILKLNDLAFHSS